MEHMVKTERYPSSRKVEILHPSQTIDLPDFVDFERNLPWRQDAPSTKRNSYLFLVERRVLSWISVFPKSLEVRVSDGSLTRTTRRRSPTTGERRPRSLVSDGPDLQVTRPRLRDRRKQGIFRQRQEEKEGG